MGFLETENAGQLLGTGSMGWRRGCQSQPELGGASRKVHPRLPPHPCGSCLGAWGQRLLACQAELLQFGGGALHGHGPLSPTYTPTHAAPTDLGSPTLGRAC